MSDKIILKILNSNLPSGRAWQNLHTFSYMEAVANELEKAKKYAFDNFYLKNSFSIHYENWKKVFNLPAEDDKEEQYNNVANRFQAKGEQNINYFKKELEKIGINVSITLCLDGAIDPAEFFKPPAGIELNETNLQLNSDKAYLNYGALPTYYTLIVNHYDTTKDYYLTQPQYITQLHKRWAFAFIIHEKNMKYDQPLTIKASKRDESIRKIIEIKNFGTWAILNAKFI